MSQLVEVRDRPLRRLARFALVRAGALVILGVPVVAAVALQPWGPSPAAGHDVVIAPADAGGLNVLEPAVRKPEKADAAGRPAAGTERVVQEWTYTGSSGGGRGHPSPGG